METTKEGFAGGTKFDGEGWKCYWKCKLTSLLKMQSLIIITDYNVSICILFACNILFNIIIIWKIAADFDEWFKNMGGSKRKSEIDKDIILELFKIQFDYPAATSLCNKQKELASLPAQVAEVAEKPEVFLPAQLKTASIYYSKA